MTKPYIDALPVPHPRSFWVVPGRLLAGEYPGNPDAEKARAKIGRLLDAGIRSFVDLTEEDETNWQGQRFVPYAPVVRALALERGAEATYARHPIRDQGVPTEEGLVGILDAVDASLSSSRPVYVHCWGGVGRTGTVVGCWLSRHGKARGEEVLALLRELRKADPTAYREAPETRAQRLLVTEWGAR